MCASILCWMPVQTAPGFERAHTPALTLKRCTASSYSNSPLTPLICSTHTPAHAASHKRLGQTTLTEGVRQQSTYIWLQNVRTNVRSTRPAAERHAATTELSMELTPGVWCLRPAPYHDGSHHIERQLLKHWRHHQQHKAHNTTSHKARQPSLGTCRQTVAATVSGLYVGLHPGVRFSLTRPLYEAVQQTAVGGSGGSLCKSWQRKTRALGEVQTRAHT